MELCKGRLKVYYFLISVLNVVIICGFSPVNLWEGNAQPSPVKSWFGYQMWARSCLRDVPSELLETQGRGLGRASRGPEIRCPHG